MIVVYRGARAFRTWKVAIEYAFAPAADPRLAPTRRLVVKSESGRWIVGPTAALSRSAVKRLINWLPCEGSGPADSPESYVSNSCSLGLHDGACSRTACACWCHKPWTWERP